jgi:hypothetical protein
MKTNNDFVFNAENTATELLKKFDIKDNIGNRNEMNIHLRCYKDYLKEEFKKTQEHNKLELIANIGYLAHNLATSEKMLNKLGQYFTLEEFRKDLFEEGIVPILELLNLDVEHFKKEIK